MNRDTPTGSPVVIAVLDPASDTRVVYETQLTGWWDIEAGTFAIPFMGHAGAAEALRVLELAVASPPRRGEPPDDDA